MDYEALSGVFRKSVRREFAFLETEFGLSVEQTMARYIGYGSSRAKVHVYHDSNYSLHIDFEHMCAVPAESIKRPFFSRLFQVRPENRRSDLTDEDKRPPYGIPEVLSAFADRSALPADLQELLTDQEMNPDSYRRWFAAETPRQVEMTVRGLADLTRKYGAGLLKGDTSQFSILQARRLARSEAQKRARLMRELELPESAGEGSQQLSTAELQFRADQQLKERILAEHSGEVSDLQDLPASEFVKRYFSRQLKGG